MKRLLSLALAIFCASGAFAQGAARVAEELGRADAASGARVELRMDSTAADAVRAADHSSGRSSVNTYGVRLFSDNSQDGRANAQAASARFAEMYPEVGANVTYESPYFWVTAGPFVDRIDAVALCGRVLPLFPKAVVVQQESLVTDIVAREKNTQQADIQE